MKIKGAIFDCDGTLIDSLGFWDIFYERVGKEFFNIPYFTVDPADDHAMRTQNIYFLSRMMHGKYGVGKSDEEVCKWCEAIFTWYYSEVVELKAGVRELLAYLKENNVKMCIASAAEASQIRLVLGRHGVLPYFEDIISCTIVGAGKDKPDIFLAAEKFLGTPHDQTWVFEDSVLAIETAKKAGFPVVGIYDANGFGQTRAEELSDVWVPEGASFAELIPQIEA